MPAGSQLTHPLPYNSPRATTWASVARGEGASAVNIARPQQQPAVTAAEFIALYDWCLASGLKAHVAFSHAAGRQTLSLSCIFPAPAGSPAGSAAAAGKRRRRHRRRRRRGRAATVAPDAPVWATPPTAASTAVQAPQPALPETSPGNAPSTREKTEETEK
jgi:hypothetical protein